MSNFVQLMQQIAKDSNAAGMPVHLMFGTVTSANPLTINVEQRLNLTSELLILTNAVKDHVVEMTIDEHETEEAILSASDTDLTHTHKYTGKKKFTVHNALKVGESVILLRMQSGQKFLVLDRLGEKK